MPGGLGGQVLVATLRKADQARQEAEVVLLERGDDGKEQGSPMQEDACAARGQDRAQGGRGRQQEQQASIAAQLATALEDPPHQQKDEQSAALPTELMTRVCRSHYTMRITASRDSSSTGLRPNRLNCLQ